jgi:hypothetical protein
MPECPEIALTAQLLSKYKNKTIKQINIFMMRGKINVIAIIHFKKLLIYFLKNKLIFSILNTYETHFFNRKI